MNPVIFSLKAYAKALNTPLSKHVEACINKSDYKSLVSLDIQPSDYECAEAFRHDYNLTTWARKCNMKIKGLDPKAAALSAFFTAERLCGETNSIIKLERRGEFLYTPRVNAVLHRARQKIAKVLDGFEIDPQDTRFGPGSTYDLKSDGASVAEKQKSFSVSASCRPYASLLLQDKHRFHAYSGVWAEGEFSPLLDAVEVVPGNRMCTVPKNAKTDRTICIEPTINMEIQLSIGRFIRRRLKSLAGIDLDDQSINQRLAQAAQGLGLATIDLSMASDTIALELVFALLPVEIACLLDEVRSRHTVLPDGTIHKNNKFSSMGNGFTFELETLIFWALSSSLGDHDWSAVYGDDIIIHQSDIRLMREVFAALGFNINLEKSFWNGVFYESCGKHYFNGTDVTPIYHKHGDWSRETLLRMANRIMRYDVRSNHGVSLTRVFQKPWLSVVSYLLSRNKKPIHVTAEAIREYPWQMPLLQSDGALYEGDDGLAVTSDLLTIPVVDGCFKGRSWKFQPQSEEVLDESLALGAWLRTPQAFGPDRVQAPKECDQISMKRFYDHFGENYRDELEDIHHEAMLYWLKLDTSCRISRRGQGRFVSRSRRYYFGTDSLVKGYTQH